MSNPKIITFKTSLPAFTFMGIENIVRNDSLWAAVMLHLRILQEETHMEKTCGAEYREYRTRTVRYFG